MLAFTKNKVSLQTNAKVVLYYLEPKGLPI